MNRIVVALMAGALMLGAAGCGETTTTAPTTGGETTEPAPATTEEAPANQ